MGRKGGEGKDEAGCVKKSVGRGGGASDEVQAQGSCLDLEKGSAEVACSTAGGMQQAMQVSSATVCGVCTRCACRGEMQPEFALTKLC